MPTPLPPPAMLIRMAGLTVMIFWAASFITGMWAVPPLILILPDASLKLSMSAA
ncbi:MAG: hypothetical protein P8010_15655 [Desulfosarcinaceae bacterium]